MAAREGHRLAAVPPGEEESAEARRSPGDGGRRVRLLLVALAALALLAVVALVGWIGASREAGRLESALATRTRALEAARTELRAWEAHRDAVSARLESFAGALEELRGLVDRGPAGEGEAAVPRPPAPAEEPER